MKPVSHAAPDGTEASQVTVANMTAVLRVDQNFMVTLEPSKCSGQKMVSNTSTHPDADVSAAFEPVELQVETFTLPAQNPMANVTLVTVPSPTSDA